MNEHRAREATLLEAFETAQPPSPSWSDDDRRWADRVAVDASPVGTAADAFVALRAGHAMQRLGAREPALARYVARPAWQRGSTAVIALVAFGLGVVGDVIGGGQHINLLAPPLWGVLAWNAVVYVLLLAMPLVNAVRAARQQTVRAGVLVRVAEALLRVRQRLPRASAGGNAAAVRGFAALWLARSRRLALLRGQAALHVGAAALGVGLVAGLYARGLVLDYRVGWESTFLGAEAAHALVTTVFGPAAVFAGIALPDVATFTTLQTVSGRSVAGGAVGAPAAPWLHLVALTLLLFVVLPRLLLALGCAVRVAWRAQHFVLPADAPYFQRLARLGRGGAAHVVVFPYATTPSPQATLGLRTLLGEALGGRIEVLVAPAVAFGGEDETMPRPIAPDTTHAVLLFDLGATPEAEHHGRFVDAIGAVLPAGAVLAVLVDSTAFERRFAGLGTRLAERREAWRLWGESVGLVPVPLDLEAPDVSKAEPFLQAAFVAVPKGAR